MNLARLKNTVEKYFNYQSQCKLTLPRSPAMSLPYQDHLPCPYLTKITCHVLTLPRSPAMSLGNATALHMAASRSSSMVGNPGFLGNTRAHVNQHVQEHMELDTSWTPPLIKFNNFVLVISKFHYDSVHKPLILNLFIMCQHFNSDPK